MPTVGMPEKYGDWTDWLLCLGIAVSLGARWPSMGGRQFHKPAKRQHKSEISPATPMSVENPARVAPRSWITAENVFYGFVVATLLSIVAIVLAPPDQRTLMMARILLFASWAGFAVVIFKSHFLHAASPSKRVTGKCISIVIIGAVALVTWVHWLDTPRLRRMARNKTLMDDCRTDYVLSHNPVEGEILDGHKILNSAIAHLETPLFRCLVTVGASFATPSCLSD